MSTSLTSATNSEQGSLFDRVRNDFLPSIVVFLVALPLCMGIAIASGVPVAAGLITGIVGGLIVGFLSGSPLQVSGPAAGLTVIIYGIVQQYGIETFGIIVLIAGAMQLTAGLLKMGQWFRAVSPAVIQGMLAGIGVLILSSQIHVMIDDKPKESGLKNLLTIPEAIVKGLPLPYASTREERQLRTQLIKQIGTLHDEQTQLERNALALVPRHQVASDNLPEAELATLAESQVQLKDKLSATAENFSNFPSANERIDNARKTSADALAAADRAIEALHGTDAETIHQSLHDVSISLQATLSQLKSHHWASKIGLLTILVLLGWQGFAPKRLKMIPAPLVAVTVATIVAAVWALPVLYVEVPNQLFNEINFASFNVLSEISIWTLLKAAAVLAVVASAETLLCATAVDKMQTGCRTNYDRELAAQGVGNIICGFLGALPMTGVIVRSAANVQAGARSRVSAILHGLWLLVFVAFLAFLLRSIPVAALAAILVYTGYKLVNLKVVKELHKYGWGEVVTYFATMIMIVSTDLLTGVIVGILLAAVRLLHTFSHLETKLENEEDGRTRLSLEGTATFLRLPVLAKQLEQVPANAELHVDFEHLDYIDHACLDLLMSWAKQHENVGGSLVIDWDSLHASFGQSPVERRRERRVLATVGTEEHEEDTVIFTKRKRFEPSNSH